MLTFVIIIVIVWMLIYLWVVIWDARARNEFYKEKKELIKEKDWWIDKFNEVLSDLKSANSKVKDVQEELKDAICRNNDLWKENEILTNQINGYLARFGELKLTIAQQHQEEIVQYYEEWLSLDKIAEKIWCWRTTIHRAIKKWWLTR